MSPQHNGYGPENTNWRGDSATTQAGRARAERRYALKPCESCGKTKTERHHKDNNTLNNEPHNIAFLCRRCHMAEDGRLNKLPRKRGAHCYKGHPLIEGNLYGRSCKRCKTVRRNILRAARISQGLCPNCRNSVSGPCPTCREIWRKKYHAKD